MAEDLDKKTLNSALRILCYASNNTYQLAFKLRKKGFSNASIEKAIKQLNSWSYIDDDGWINGYIRVQKKRFHGPKYILNKLLQNHIPKDTALLSLSQSYSLEEEKYWIRKFIELKSSTMNSHKDKSLIFKKLLQRGFHYEHIYSELSTILTTHPI